MGKKRSPQKNKSPVKQKSHDPRKQRSQLWKALLHASENTDLPLSEAIQKILASIAPGTPNKHQRIVDQLKGSKDSDLERILAEVNSREGLSTHIAVYAALLDEIKALAPEVGDKVTAAPASDADEDAPVLVADAPASEINNEAAAQAPAPASEVVAKVDTAAADAGEDAPASDADNDAPTSETTTSASAPVVNSAPVPADGQDLGSKVQTIEVMLNELREIFSDDEAGLIIDSLRALYGDLDLLNESSGEKHQSLKERLASFKEEQNEKAAHRQLYQYFEEHAWGEVSTEKTKKNILKKLLKKLEKVTDPFEMLDFNTAVVSVIESIAALGLSKYGKTELYQTLVGAQIGINEVDELRLRLMELEKDWAKVAFGPGPADKNEGDEPGKNADEDQPEQRLSQAARDFIKKLFLRFLAKVTSKKKDEVLASYAEVLANEQSLEHVLKSSDPEISEDMPSDQKKKLRYYILGEQEGVDEAKRLKKERNGWSIALYSLSVVSLLATAFSVIAVLNVIPALTSLMSADLTEALLTWALPILIAASVGFLFKAIGKKLSAKNWTTVLVMTMFAGLTMNVGFSNSPDILNAFNTAFGSSALGSMLSTTLLAVIILGIWFGVSTASRQKDIKRVDEALELMVKDDKALSSAQKAEALIEASAKNEAGSMQPEAFKATEKAFSLDEELQSWVTAQASAAS